MCARAVTMSRFARTLTPRVSRVLEPGERVVDAVAIPSALDHAMKRERRMEHVMDAAMHAANAAAVASDLAQGSIPGRGLRHVHLQDVASRGRAEVLVVTDRAIVMVVMTPDFRQVKWVQTRFARSIPLRLEGGTLRLGGERYHVGVPRRSALRRVDAAREAHPAVLGA